MIKSTLHGVLPQNPVLNLYPGTWHHTRRPRSPPVPFSRCSVWLAPGSSYRSARSAPGGSPSPAPHSWRVFWELRTARPLAQLRLLGRRSVLAGNLTGLLVALGFYPLMSLVVRYVQTPPVPGPSNLRR